ncbi:MAG TPA: phenylalanine--tRNA ligase subunit beta [Candidatus Paceibacterota bacterium]|nr:phenylalanine--tRNA ligase subunit beta [Candidatus Paceibacterota bacterium]
MRVPLSWIREFTDVPESLSNEEISDAFVRVGFEVEQIYVTGADISGPLKVGRVVNVETITEFKKPIRWVELDCGEDATRFVICGADNFVAGDLVVVALPGATLPGGFAISQRETYGKTSNGMICSSRELGLSDEHSGILVLPAGSASIGDDALTLLDIADVVFDIAVNPDRGYALSMRGMAREIAASLGVGYRDPVSSINVSAFPISKSGSNGGVEVAIDDPTGASVIYIRTLNNFDPSASSPLWMSRRLEKCGMRSISLAVDVTNYVMLELGQPLHAFDSKRINGSLHIRRAGTPIQFTTLDGQERVLAPEDLLVADDIHPLAIAGTMGGLDSEVTLSTTTLAIEAARFDPISIAKNSRQHRISSEASRRFERGVDPSLAEFASARASQLLIDLGGAAHVASQKAGEPRYSPIVDFDPAYVATLTGAEISIADVEKMLLIVGCDIEKSSEKLWKIDPPSWRSDLKAPADLVEEVARMVGYDTIPSVLPPPSVSPGLTHMQLRRRAISQLMADRGLVEIQTYPFTSESVMKSLGFTGVRGKAFRLSNPMSEDAPLLRTHLIPGLIEAAQRNLGRGNRNFGIFEIGLIFQNATELASIENPSTEQRPTREQIDAIYAGVPNQPLHLGGLLVGLAEKEDWRGKGRAYDWTDAIELAGSVLSACNLEWSIGRSDFAPWHPGRCAEILVAGKIVAHAGELHPRVVAEFGLPARTCAFVVNLSALPAPHITRAPMLGTLPVAVQDIALIVDESIPSAAVVAALVSGAGQMLESIELFDRYSQIGAGKVSLAFTLTFRAPDRTLTGAEVAQMREAAVDAARNQLGAVLRSS